MDGCLSNRIGPAGLPESSRGALRALLCPLKPPGKKSQRATPRQVAEEIDREASAKDAETLSARFATHGTLVHPPQAWPT